MGTPCVCQSITEQRTTRKTDMGMQYTTEVLDRRSGELVSLDLGVFVTVSELGQALGLTPRKIRKVLHVLDMASPEGSRGNYRLTREAVAKGYGRRIDRPKKGRYAFDTISPAGQQLVRERLGWALVEIEQQRVPLADTMSACLDAFKARRAALKFPELTLKGEVAWLSDHFPNAGSEEIASATGGAAGKVRQYLSAHRHALSGQSALLLDPTQASRLRGLRRLCMHDVAGSAV